LVVDDEPDMLDFLCRALRGLYQVTPEKDPAAAADLLHQAGWALVVTDQEMPGLSGLTMLETCAGHQIHTARLLLTGHADPAIVPGAVKAGLIDAYVLKPVDTSTLLAACKAAINRRQERNGERL